MPVNVVEQMAQFEHLGVAELLLVYAEIFGEATNTRNKTWLLKRIAWRLQANTHGGLSHEAQERAKALANPADLRVVAPTMATTGPQHQTVTVALPTGRDPRLPATGTIIMRVYKGKLLKVVVQHDTFEYAGASYSSLSAVAKAITGSHCNGFHFFKLTTEKR